MIVGGVSLLFAYSLKEGVNDSAVPAKKPVKKQHSDDIELLPVLKSNEVDERQDSDDDGAESNRLKASTLLTGEERKRTGSEHIVVEMKRVDTSNTTERRNVIPPFIPLFAKKSKSEHIKNPNKVRHSPTPSFDSLHPVTFATHGIATGSLLKPGSSSGTSVSVLGPGSSIGKERVESDESKDQGSSRYFRDFNQQEEGLLQRKIGVRK